MPLGRLLIRRSRVQVPASSLSKARFRKDLRTAKLSPTSQPSPALNLHSIAFRVRLPFAACWEQTAPSLPAPISALALAPGTQVPPPVCSLLHSLPDLADEAFLGNLIMGRKMYGRKMNSQEDPPPFAQPRACWPQANFIVARGNAPGIARARSPQGNPNVDAATDAHAPSLAEGQPQLILGHSPALVPGTRNLGSPPVCSHLQSLPDLADEALFTILGNRRPVGETQD